ncbi:MAG: C-3',4' desaturase CrtD [Prochlorococcus sp.]|nr:C-3',4' desaturase CrtD [Prochlorococcaceae cyanobacterium ETNP18_MAG_1]
MSDQSVIVIGAGIAGLTAAALLAKEGVDVTVLEASHQPGGCAGSFKRGAFLFDVGATQVAGLESGGNHERLFRHLNLPMPAAELLDPGCVVDLADGSAPIQIWHNPELWREEQQRQFPGSDSFWSLCADLHRSNWAFARRDAVVQPRSLWDLGQLLQALRPENITAGLLSRLTVADLLRLCGCGDDQRLRHFLDLQLKLYSQEPADRTAALYGATVLQMAQAPHGLWHLQGSMQKLSEALSDAIQRDGGQLLLNHRVERLDVPKQGRPWSVGIKTANGNPITLRATDVICSLPPQCLKQLIPVDDDVPKAYQQKLQQLTKPSGALVFYGAIKRSLLPKDCPGHMQRAAKKPGPLFLSISRDGDGRAPLGQASLIASVFTPTSIWMNLEEPAYQQRKQKALREIRQTLERWLDFTAQDWLHQELATPRSFATWTGRPQGIVGGLGQSPANFGPFGLASRTPMRGLWLCGDSIHPGEGTAGVSMSALIACRQLLATRGQQLKVAA